MTEKIHLNAKIPKNLHDDLVFFMESERIPDKTAALCELVRLGLQAKKDNERNSNLFEQVSLRTLFYLRAIAETRGEEFLKEIDAQFEAEKENLEEMLIKFGVGINDA